MTNVFLFYHMFQGAPAVLKNSGISIMAEESMLSKGFDSLAARILKVPIYGNDLSRLTEQRGFAWGTIEKSSMPFEDDFLFSVVNDPSGRYVMGPRECGVQLRKGLNLETEFNFVPCNYSPYDSGKNVIETMIGKWGNFRGVNPKQKTRPLILYCSEKKARELDLL